IWVGGGKVHTPRPRDYSLRMPRKMRRAALRSALSVKAAEQGILVVDHLSLESPKTREMQTVLNRLVGDSSALVLLGAERDEAVRKSLRNLPKAKALAAQYLNVRDLLGYERVIMPLDALDVIASYLGE
ncbi:MAG TPA: 50S ribosomal protein L4, partial [Chloroflexi bacterium]|nr:50S ribosomal protein L4 [Chloroflexota bacterium]